MRNALTSGLLVAALALAGCAAARPPGSPPDTEVSVVDASGSSVPGEYELVGAAKDSCQTSGDGCAVNLPEGDYSFRFSKTRYGRFAQAGGVEAGGEKVSGCLRARVHLVPGTPITCKQLAPYSCAGSASETMDCGQAGIAAWNAHHPALAAPKQ